MKTARGAKAAVLRAAVLLVGTASLVCMGAAQTRRRQAPLKPGALIDVTVSEGTSMSVAVSPDGKRWPWTCRAASGLFPPPAERPNELPVCLTTRASRCGRPTEEWIAFFGYHDGGYDIWAIAPDGSNEHKLTWGPLRRSRAGLFSRRNAPGFSSDRGNPLGSSYNIWVLDLQTAA